MLDYNTVCFVTNMFRFITINYTKIAQKSYDIQLRNLKKSMLLNFCLIKFHDVNVLRAEIKITVLIKNVFFRRAIY